ncbi:MAG: hypothetical protein IMY67_06500 [Bacteroidetes bacterium]|nr:hypothetical protein [Bacteroidota bacterium]
MEILTFTEKNDAQEELDELIKADEIRMLNRDEYGRFKELKDAINKFNEIILNWD